MIIGYPTKPGAKRRFKAVSSLVWKLSGQIECFKKLRLKKSMVYMCFCIYLRKYICSPPPPRSTFCILLSAQSSTRNLFAQLKRKNEKNRKNQKKKTEEMSQPEFPQSLWFFCPLPAFGIHYFPKKTVFLKIFPAIYFIFFLWRPDFFKGQ